MNRQESKTRVMATSVDISRIYYCDECGITEVIEHSVPAQPCAGCGAVVEDIGHVETALTTASNRIDT